MKTTLEKPHEHSQPHSQTHTHAPTRTHTHTHTHLDASMLSQMADEDTGEERLETRENITWQRKLIPIAPPIDSCSWHTKNNELLFQLRSEFVALAKHIKKPPPKPPPEGGGTRGTKRSVLTIHEHTSSAQDAQQGPTDFKRRRRSRRLLEQTRQRGLDDHKIA